MSLASAAHDPTPAWGPVGEPLQGFLREHLEELEGRLAEVCSELGQGLGPLSHALERAVGTDGGGGQRWRPLLTLAAASALHGERGAALDVAVAVELTHTASLVLDDLPCMDDSSLRRGQPATHRKVGSAGAILLSVALLARAVELLGRQPQAGGELAAEWGRTVGLHGMSGGQAIDVASAGKTLRGSARRLHREKSTALPAFALSAGARCAQAGAASGEGLARFGRSLGWAYQLLDDADDVAEDRRLGRPAAGSPPLLLARRIMRRAYRGLRWVPGLDPHGIEVLAGLAGRVAMPEADCICRDPRRAAYGRS